MLIFFEVNPSFPNWIEVFRKRIFRNYSNCCFRFFRFRFSCFGSYFIRAAPPGAARFAPWLDARRTHRTPVLGKRDAVVVVAAHLDAERIEVTVSRLDERLFAPVEERRFHKRHCQRVAHQIPRRGGQVSGKRRNEPVDVDIRVRGFARGAVVDQRAGEQFPCRRVGRSPTEQGG